RRAVTVEHGVAGVEDDVGDEVGLLLVLLDGVALGPAVALPVDVADVVAGDVLAVLDELDGEAAEGALVLADAQAFDDAARLEAQGGGAGEDVGVEGQRHQNSTTKHAKHTKRKTECPKASHWIYFIFFFLSCVSCVSWFLLFFISSGAS